MPDCPLDPLLLHAGEVRARVCVRSGVRVTTLSQEVSDNAHDWPVVCFRREDASEPTRHVLLWLDGDDLNARRMWGSDRRGRWWKRDDFFCNVCTVACRYIALMRHHKA